MEVILIFAAGFIVFIIAILSVVKMAINRTTEPKNELKNEINNLKQRVNELEDEKK